jgi:hypothetical protein
LKPVLTRIWATCAARFRSLLRKPNASPSKGKHKGKRKKGKKRRPKPLQRLRWILRTAWTKIPTWVKAVVIPATLLITLFQAYPWLSIQKDVVLDPKNPYSQMFLLRNTGYIPITSLDANCIMAFTDNHGNTWDRVSVPSPRFAGYLAHDWQTTVPCFNAIDVRHNAIEISAGAFLNVHISYAFFYVNISPLRRSQEFHFKSVIAKDGTQHWTFLD